MTKFNTYTIIAQQISTRNENRCESENRESHILKTSGSENSCDNNNVNHLKNYIDK